MPKRNSRHRIHDRRIYAFFGFLLGLGAPTGWLMGRMLFTHAAWLKSELTQFGPAYTYMTIGTIVVLTLFGYFVGRHSDNIGDQSDAVKETLGKVNQMAITDALTNIYNARYLHDQLSTEME